MSYENKYLKYKNKYLCLKKNLIGGGPKLKVLIVVDVQTCFLHGTMRNPNKELVEIYEKKILKFVEEKKNEYDVIIFTKDNHPQHHMSYGLYSPHCTESTATYCGKEKKEEENRKKMIEKLYNTSPLTNKEKGYTDELNADMRDKYGKNLGLSFEEGYRYNTKIKLKQEFLECTSAKKNLNELDISGPCLKNTEAQDPRNKKIKLFTSNIEITNIEPKKKIKDLTPYIIRMNKGELCNFDAYGAFAYHVSYQQKENKLEEIDIVHNPSLSPTDLDWKKLSTGLAEFLINKKNYHKEILPSELNIDVCGLVTNICVVSTCVTGCKVFEALNFKTYKFNILNEYCLNLYNYKLTGRNAQKIINDNNLVEKIKITRESDVAGFNPTTEEII